MKAAKGKSVTKTDELAVTTTRVVLDMPSTEQLGKLEGMQDEYNLSPSYWTQNKWATMQDKPIKAFFLGMKQIPNKDGELIHCAVFATNFEVFLAAQMILVEAVQTLETGTAVKITYKGTKPNKSTDGETNLFEIVRLKSDSQ